MPGSRKVPTGKTQNNKNHPTQKTHAEVDKGERLLTGDIIAVNGQSPQENGLYLVADVSHKGDKIKAVPVKLDEKKRELTMDKSRRAIELDVNSPNIKRENFLIQNTQALENLAKDKPKEKQIEKPKEHAVSFSVVTNGDSVGFVTGGNSYERIVNAKTSNGVTYTANISSGNVSRSALDRIADAIAKSRDYNNENLDERKAYDDVQDVVNQDKDIEAIIIEGGPTINRSEIGHEVSAPVGKEEVDPYNPDGVIEDDIDAPEDNPNSKPKIAEIADFAALNEDSSKDKNGNGIKDEEELDDSNDLDDIDEGDFSMSYINEFCYDDDDEEPSLGDPFPYD